MTRSKVTSFCTFLTLAALLIVVAPLRASDPVGAYAIVDKIVLEPATGPAMAVQIHGVFSIAIRRNPDFTQPFPAGSYGTPNTGDVYAAVKKGYVYAMCPRGKETLCRNEWADLQALAGKPDVIGFGSRWEMSVRVRPASEKPENPDVYSLNVGLVKMGQYGNTGMQNRSQYPDMIAALQAASRSK